jgi:arginase
MPGWTVIGVPIDSVGRSGGTEHAPRVMREAGVVDLLGARDAGDLDVHICDERRDPETGVVGSGDVLSMTAVVRAAVRETAAAGERPFVLGGCCSLVPGAMAGVRDVSGTLGVANVDGHVDVYDGASSPTGEAADMPIGVALGREPAAWVDVAGGPSTRPDLVIALGARDPEEREDIAALMAGELAGVEAVSPEELRADGLEAVAERSAERLAERAGGFWLHLDVDVLDEAVMPATDYLMPGGLGWEELAALLRPLAASPALAGVSLGCVNPEKDPDGSCVSHTTTLLAAVFG